MSNRGIAKCLVGAKPICSHARPYLPIPFPAHGLCAPTVVSGGTCNISLTSEHTIGINSPHLNIKRTILFSNATLANWLIPLGDLACVAHVNLLLRVAALSVHS